MNLMAAINYFPWKQGVTDKCARFGDHRRASPQNSPTLWLLFSITSLNQKCWYRTTLFQFHLSNAEMTMWRKMRMCGVLIFDMKRQTLQVTHLHIFAPLNWEIWWVCVIVATPKPTEEQIFAVSGSHTHMHSITHTNTWIHTSIRSLFTFCFVHSIVMRLLIRTDWIALIILRFLWEFLSTMDGESSVNERKNPSSPTYSRCIATTAPLLTIITMPNYGCLKIWKT